MAQITITIPDAVLPRVLDAFASTYHYSAKLPDGSTNPQTKAQFAKQQVLYYVKSVVVNSEARAAAVNAAATAKTTANTDIALT